MGNHRMFTNDITDSDLFVEMPLSAQALYFHLGLHADDEGFLSSPKRILRAVGCNEDDLKILITKGFVVWFESGIIVVTHWYLHNSIRKDRKKNTIYTVEKKQLMLENDVYFKLDNQVTTNCQPTDNQVTTICPHKLSKDKLSKDKISKENNMSTYVDGRNAFDYQSVANSFNSICTSLPNVQKLTDTRKKKIKNAAKLLGDMSFEDLFYLVENSDFLSGRSGKWNACGFDWILNPQNLTKIIEGNYKNKENFNTTVRNYEEELF